MYQEFHAWANFFFVFLAIIIIPFHLLAKVYLDAQIDVKSQWVRHVDVIIGSISDSPICLEHLSPIITTSEGEIEQA